MANSTNRVVVTFNYRLGAFGFMNNDLLSGNFGTLDQQAALIWCHNSISAFGGDPSNVTLFGQSAGAHSVMLHLVLQASNGLFSNAIMQSNPAALILRPHTVDVKYGYAMAGFLDCVASDLGCLRNRTADQVLAAQRSVLFFPSILPMEDFPWQPTLDGVLITDQPLALIRKGSWAKVPIMIGNVANETYSFILGTITSPMNAVDYDAVVALSFQTSAPLILAEYPPTNVSDTRPTLSELGTDFVFRCPSRALARYSVLQGVPAAMYIMTHAPLADPENLGAPCQAIAACHGADVTYVFHCQGFFPTLPTTAAEQNLSWHMMMYWTGAGNGPVPIPSYNPVTDISLQLDLNVTLIAKYRSAYCDFWDKLMGW